MSAKAEVLRIAEELIDISADLSDGKYGRKIWEVADRLRALAASMLEQLPARGWKLVPVEPTQAMMEAGYKEYGSFQYWPRVKEIQGWGDRANLIYKAMLTAAPAPKETRT